jgi:ABC-2 type transport system permease protein
MRDILTITRRELAAYFNAPVAYVFIVVFILVTCGMFMTTFFLAGTCTMRTFFASLPLILIVFVPAVTMRLWAEERKTGTLALLLSLPTSSFSLCTGKFLASLAFGILALAGTATLPLMLAALGEPDLGPILGGYAGSILLFCLLLAMGMAVSAFFADQIVAFILTLVLGFGCYLIGTEFISTFVDGWVPGFGTFLRDTLGIPSHFSAFEKGVVDLGDVAFFVSFSVILLAVNILTLEGHMRMRTSKGFAVGVVLLIGIGLLLNGVIRGAHMPRMDLTKQGLYTVSPATRKVLERLKVPITVTFYLTSRDRLPTPMKDIGRDVGDVLEELANLSGKFTYRVVDPASIPDRIPDLEKRGIVPFGAQTIEQDAVDVKRIYSSLAIAYLDRKEEIIPQVIPDILGSLEYELIARIYRLTLDEQPKVVLVSPKGDLDPQTAALLRQMGRPAPSQDDYQGVRELLESEGYEVTSQEIDREHPLPADARLLMLIAPGSLSARQRYEISQFLRKGKPVFVAVQKNRYNYDEGSAGPVVTAQQIPSDIDALLSPYGVTVNEDMLFDDRHVTLSVTSRRQVGLFTALVQTPVTYPMQIQIFPDQMDQDLSITGRLSGLLYLWGSALDLGGQPAENAGMQTRVLLRSSPVSWERPYHPGPLTDVDFNPPPDESVKALPLAVLIEGVFPDPFQGQSEPQWPKPPAGEDEAGDIGQEEQPDPGTAGQRSEEPAGSAGPLRSRLLVVGCSEMFSDTALGALGNATFLLNSVDALSLGEELINIRSKSQVERYIAPVSAQAKVLWRSFCVFTVPILWIAWGIGRAVKRRRRREPCAFSA